MTEISRTESLSEISDMETNKNSTKFTYAVSVTDIVLNSRKVHDEVGNLLSFWGDSIDDLDIKSWRCEETHDDTYTYKEEEQNKLHQIAMEQSIQRELMKEEQMEQENSFEEDSENFFTDHSSPFENFQIQKLDQEIEPVQVMEEEKKQYIEPEVEIKNVVSKDTIGQGAEIKTKNLKHDENDQKVYKKCKSKSSKGGKKRKKRRLFKKKKNQTTLKNKKVIKSKKQKADLPKLTIPIVKPKEDEEISEYFSFVKIVKRFKFFFLRLHDINFAVKRLHYFTDDSSNQANSTLYVKWINQHELSSDTNFNRCRCPVKRLIKFNSFTETEARRYITSQLDTSPFATLPGMMNSLVGRGKMILLQLPNIPWWSFHKDREFNLLNMEELCTGDDEEMLDEFKYYNTLQNTISSTPSWKRLFVTELNVLEGFWLNDCTSFTVESMESPTDASHMKNILDSNKELQGCCCGLTTHIILVRCLEVPELQDRKSVVKWVLVDPLPDKHWRSENSTQPASWIKILPVRIMKDEKETIFIDSVVDGIFFKAQKIHSSHKIKQMVEQRMENARKLSRLGPFSGFENNIPLFSDFAWDGLIKELTDEFVLRRNEPHDIIIL
jgi:hypothetical protein